MIWLIIYLHVSKNPADAKCLSGLVNKGLGFEEYRQKQTVD